MPRGLTRRRCPQLGAIGSPTAARSDGLIGGAAGLGPAWTRGEIEPPAGEEDKGGWTARVYTAEQQSRLGVNADGTPLNRAGPASDSHAETFTIVGDGPTIRLVNGLKSGQLKAVLRSLELDAKGSTADLRARLLKAAAASDTVADAIRAHPKVAAAAAPAPEPEPAPGTPGWSPKIPSQPAQASPYAANPNFAGGVTPASPRNDAHQCRPVRCLRCVLRRSKRRQRRPCRLPRAAV